MCSLLEELQFGVPKPMLAKTLTFRVVLAFFTFCTFYKKGVSSLFRSKSAKMTKMAKMVKMAKMTKMAFLAFLGQKPSQFSFLRARVSI